VAERAQRDLVDGVYPRSEPFGSTTAARQQFSWFFTRESVLRLLLSFVLSIALWLYVTNKNEPRLEYDYLRPLPVTFQSLNSKYVVDNNLGTVHLRIRVSDPNTVAAPENFRPFVNLAGFKPGEYVRVPVHVLADPGIYVIQVIPASIPIRIEAQAEVHVPVQWRTLNRPPNGYRVQSVDVSPSSVDVIGPQTLVNQVAHAAVYLDFSQTTFNTNGAYQYTLENAQGQPVHGQFSPNSPTPAQVQVFVRIQSPSAYKTVPIVLPPVKGQPKAGYGLLRLQLEPSQVLIYGTTHSLENLGSLTTSPLSIGKKSTGKLTRTVTLRFPKDVHASVKSVKVTAYIAPVDVGSSLQVGVTVAHLPPGTAVHSLKPAKLLVTVVGPSGSVQNVADRIRAQIDLSHLLPGRAYQLRPTIHVPRNYQIQTTYPRTITVTLSSQPAGG